MTEQGQAEWMQQTVMRSQTISYSLDWYKHSEPGGFTETLLDTLNENEGCVSFYLFIPSFFLHDTVSCTYKITLLIIPRAFLNILICAKWFTRRAGRKKRASISRPPAPPERIHTDSCSSPHLATRARSNGWTNGRSARGSTDCGFLSNAVKKLRWRPFCSGVLWSVGNSEVAGTGKKARSALLTLATAELTEDSTGVNMELSAVGERVFAAESIIKRRIRKVRDGTHPCWI